MFSRFSEFQTGQAILGKRIQGTAGLSQDCIIEGFEISDHTGLEIGIGNNTLNIALIDNVYCKLLTETIKTLTNNTTNYIWLDYNPVMTGSQWTDVTVGVEVTTGGAPPTYNLLIAAITTSAGDITEIIEYCKDGNSGVLNTFIQNGSIISKNLNPSISPDLVITQEYTTGFDGHPQQPTIQYSATSSILTWENCDIITANQGKYYELSTGTLSASSGDYVIAKLDDALNVATLLNKKITDIPNGWDSQKSTTITKSWEYNEIPFCRIDLGGRLHLFLNTQSITPANIAWDKTKHYTVSKTEFLDVLINQGIIFDSGWCNLSDSTTTTINHTLGAIPKFWNITFLDSTNNIHQRIGADTGTGEILPLITSVTSSLFLVSKAPEVVTTWVQCKIVAWA